MQRRIIAAGACILMAALLLFSLRQGSGFALTGFLFAVLALVPFFASFEHRRPGARDLVPIAILAAAAAVGRVIFAPLPDVKPTSAIVIVAGLAFGPESGFMTGATAALASNIFFGQGPFTPWQMCAWGLMGFAAGLMGRHRALRSLPVLLVFGFVSGFLFGWLMDLYQMLAFVSPVGLKSFYLTAAASFYFDLTHAVSNVVFLLCIAKPWMKILGRVKQKYGLLQENPL